MATDIPPDLASFVRRLVAERRFQSEDDVLAEVELREAQLLRALRDLSHQHLRARGDLYEMAAAAGRGGHDEAYWHAANGMWHAAREYCRRNADCDVATFKPGKHSSDKLGELTLEYELAASALLGLKTAMADYKKLRPDA